VSLFNAYSGKATGEAASRKVARGHPKHGRGGILTNAYLEIRCPIKRQLRESVSQGGVFMKTCFDRVTFRLI
jgi:hypothetical protein